MKYEKLQQAHTLVDGFDQNTRDLLKMFLPALPTQKTLDEIIEDVYEAYMCAEDEDNCERLSEIHYQLTNWGKIPPARETAFYFEDYDELFDDSVVLDEGRGLPWFKRWGSWQSNAGEIRDNREMAGVPREIVRKGSSYVQ